MAEQAKPECPSRVPVRVDLEAGKTYFYCTCGRSQNQPFCDGRHLGTTFTPLKFDATITKPAFLCTCKRSNKKPYCDGTHGNDDLDWW
jgi:CDGSH iron-sulfur domain-containing protein 3